MSSIRLKLTDFGLSRTISDKNTIETLGVRPLCWTAIEALEGNKFSPQSDIW